MGVVFAIDLDADVVLVEECRDYLVREGLPAHHMAPVTRGIPDAEKHGSIEFPSPLEGFLSPPPPFHRVGGVLAQIFTRAL